MENMIAMGQSEEEFLESIKKDEDTPEIIPEETPEEVIDTPEEVIDTPEAEVPESTLDEEATALDTPEAEVPESTLDEEATALDKELEEIEKLLGDVSEDLSEAPSNTDGDNTELTDKLTKAAKDINSLQAKIADYQLKEAENAKFGDNYGLEPEIIIIKANYDKAKKGDEVARSKIKELIENDLGLSLQNTKEMFVSNSITSRPNVNINKSDDDFFGIVG